ncbi:uncharacterized protein LDX57_011639 [Aspergillus melleus]|uniref:uncharacterized protein n=1 Tax=Aspergillus melleus TaxID=138277 RepID=UPI001E8CA686|nr:uncharacterized protein LDX57_011639 [Aspergillus melleus]KAH8434003.1 hypothetical protein LDX57_011639 [Aspergillus melleus]
MPSLLGWSILLSSGVALSVYRFHKSLSKRVSHEHRQGAFPETLRNTITSIPDAVFSDEFHCFHDRVASRVSRRDLPSQDLSELFVLLLRRNMTAFAYFPQAYILHLIATPERKCTFCESHIQSLRFQVGDVVNGIYRVCEREDNKVVFAIDAKGPIEGRLAIRYWEEEDEVVYCNETAMWTQKAKENKKQATLPLERPVLKFLHECAAWWLLDSGTRYLTGLRESPEQSKSQ